MQPYPTDLESLPEEHLTIDTLENFRAAFTANSELWFEAIRVMAHNSDKYRNHGQVLYDKAVEFSNQAAELGRFAETTEAEYNKLNTIYQAFKEGAASNLQASHSQNPRRSATVPDPEKFDGTDKGYLRNFIHLIKNKLESNADHFTKDTEEATCNARKTYVWTRTKGTVADQILPQITGDSNAYGVLHTAEDVLDFLKRTWDDPDRQQSAQYFIHTLAQKNRRFRDYLSDFQTHIPDTGYDNTAQLSHFKRGLSMELKDKLIVLGDLPLGELIQKCQQMDNQIHSLKNNAFYRKPNSGTTTPGTASNRSVSAPVTPSASPALSATSYGSGSPEPMDLSAATAALKNYRNMTPEQKAHQRQHRLDHDLCLYCDAPGHKLAACTKKPNTRVVQLRGAGIAPVAPATSAPAPDSENA